MNKLKVWCAGSMFVVTMLAALLVVTAGNKAFAQDDPDRAPAEELVEDEGGVQLGENGQMALFFSIAITVGIGCLSAGYAVGKVGAAALGAASEKPEIMGRALIFVGLAEGIAIYGLIVGIMLIMIL